MHHVTQELVDWAIGRTGERPAWLEPHTVAMIEWATGGMPAPAPAFLKREIVADYVARSGYQRFVETGTHAGDTTERVASLDVRVDSIELGENYYNHSKERLAGYPKVTLWLGDSTQVIPKILAELSEPAVFYLDGHYSGGDTALGDKATPIVEELFAIYEHSIKTHVILIDDARCFQGGDYPRIEDVIAEVQNRLPGYDVTVEHDIIRAVPPGWGK